MTSQYHATAVEELKHLYTFRNEAQIVEFLDANPNLYDFLREVQPTLQSYFPAETFALELITSHEEEDYQQLFVYVETQLDVDEAMDILEVFINDHWVHFNLSIRTNMAVNVSFR